VTIARPKIWVDADACPKVIKEILYRAADRVGIVVILVANRSLQIPDSPNIRAHRVGSGLDAADGYIAREASKGDLVVTADIPLAAEVVAKGCRALNPRGEVYDEDNISQRLGMRDFMDELRGCGVNTGGPASFSKADRRAFAGQLDRMLAKIVS